MTRYDKIAYQFGGHLSNKPNEECKESVYVCWFECRTRPYLRGENLALCGWCVGVRGDGRAGIDIVCVDVVTDATADGTAVVPAGNTQTHRKKLTLMLLRQ